MPLRSGVAPADTNVMAAGDSVDDVRRRRAAIAVAFVEVTRSDRVQVTPTITLPARYAALLRRS